MERFIPVEIVRKKVIPFEILPFSRFYRNDRNFLCYSFGSAPRSKSRESKKFTGICKWNNSISILFLVPKKYQYHMTEIFHRK